MAHLTDVTPAKTLKLHPQPNAVSQDALGECIRSCLAAVHACTVCADACLAEDRPDRLIACIRLSQDCADICMATARVLARQTLPDSFTLRTLLLACAAATGACALECLEHAAMHEHCRVCAEACRDCEHACLALTQQDFQ